MVISKIKRTKSEVVVSHLLSLKDAHEYISNKKLHNLPHQYISTLHI